jgi:hypothetical protein
MNEIRVWRIGEMTITGNTGDNKLSEITQVPLQIYAPRIPHGQSWNGTQTFTNYLTYGTAHPSTANGLPLIKSTSINSTTATLIYHG